MNYQILRSSIPVLAAVLLAATAAVAGDGRVRSVAGTSVLDFCVSIRFTATQSELTNIRRAFSDANVVLADATDGQFRFGQIDLVNSSGASRQAEVWILSGAGRAYATCGLYGTPGEHIVMFYDSNFTAQNGTDGDSYTIAHEFAHHLWGVKDEYSGPSGNADCEATPGSNGAEFCLMDNYFTRGGRSGGGNTYTLNEFCVATNHDPDGDTYQENKWMDSCWARIASHPSRPAAAPATLPTSAAPAVPSPTFRLPATDRRFVLCLDRSGSMATLEGASTRLDFAKQASALFVQLTKVNDRVGVTSFATNAQTNLGLTQITGAAQRNQIVGVVNGLVASGSTAIGGGLIQSIGVLTSATQPSCAQTVVLFTDGLNNVAPAPLSVVPSLTTNDITVISIAIGTGTNPSELQQISTQTGGKFFQVMAAADLPPLLLALSAESTGGGVLARQPSAVAAGKTVVQDVLVDSATAEAAFALTWPDPSDDLDLSLRSPTGKVINATTALTNPNVDAIAGPNSEILQLRRPTLETGTWTVMVTGSVVNGAGTFELVALSDAQGTSLTAGTDRPNYTYPEPVLVMATPRFKGCAVVGANVTGTVRRPNGTTSTVTLFDDGATAHGDDVASDGVYSARFDTFAGSGVYAFDLQVVSNNATTFGGESLFAATGTPPARAPVPPFQRQTTVSAVVSGVPQLPQFDPTSPCGQVLMTSVGVPLSFQVAASSPGGTPVTLNVSGLPAGATTNQMLPATGTSPSVRFDWTPSNAQTGRHVLDFVAEAGGQRVTCQVTIDVAECFLVLGTTRQQVALAPGDDLLVVPQNVWPVTMTSLPSLDIPNDPTLSGVQVCTQVLMFNPLSFPNDPLQTSNGLATTLGGTALPYGPSSGITHWLEGTPRLGGTLELRFSINGL